MKYVGSLIALIISELLIIFTVFFILKSQKKKSQLKTSILVLLSCLFIWAFGSILQILCQNLSIPLIMFEKISVIGAVFSPVAFLALAIIFAKGKIELRWYHSLFLVIPILSIILLWTNESHQLFFANYTQDVSQIVYGKYFAVHSIYTYLLFGIGLLYLFKYIFKNAGFFSRQSILLITGSLIPLLANITTILNIFEFNTYITPISFSIMALFYAFAIFKFNLAKITPIPLQRILDRISDGYIVIDENNVITDFNTTFLSMFGTEDNQVRNKNIFNWVEEYSDFPITNKELKEKIEKTKRSDITLNFERKLNNKNKYFHIEINSIRSKNAFLCTLILFKDTTQHMQDMQTIKDNQEMLMEGERLASLGQLIGGIAHNLKTPIMSIAGAAEGLSDLVKEYDMSIENPNVNHEDHHAIASDMTSWINKIKEYTEYMSDIITAVKGQAVTLSEKETVSFNLEELVKRVDILMKHELKNAILYLTIRMHVDSKLSINGDINSLVQVINNMISNSIQAYNGKTEESIILDFSQEGNNLIIAVEDHASGMPKNVTKKLFKEMVTTKGKNGTGLGLYMSYSTIKGHFNGNITFETEEGKGTTFKISLPI